MLARDQTLQILIYAIKKQLKLLVSKDDDQVNGSTKIAK